MKNFEYAQPTSEAQLLGLLSTSPGKTELLGGGTDLIGLMKAMIVAPERVVNVSDVEPMRRIEVDEARSAVRIGAAVRLDEIGEDSRLQRFAAMQQVVASFGCMQVPAQSTLGGELLRRPRCWYFRSGHGLLADGGRMVEAGDNRFHAILGNRGPAKFVNASRLAPALIALGAKARIIGPGEEDELVIPLEDLYQTPHAEGVRENTLRAGQVLSHVVVPMEQAVFSGVYEVRQTAGPDEPLAAAAAALHMEGSIVRAARLVLGQVAPTPWVAHAAAESLVGHIVDQAAADRAGRLAVADASPLSQNEYKVNMAFAAAKRAILRAAGLPTGGF